jgi:hypothetical protein
MNDRPVITLDQLVQSFSKPELSLPEPRSYASPSYGPRVDEPQKTIEIRNPRAGEGAVATDAAFYTFYTDGDGDIFLQGGTINGLAVDTSDLKLYDAGTTSWVGTADQHLFVPVTGAFVVVDSVAMPGFVASSIGTVGYGTPTTNTFPAVTGTTTASNGICYVSLGVFVADGFLPSNRGNRVISLCITPPYTGHV